jgi:hypothetical protein
MFLKDYMMSQRGRSLYMLWNKKQFMSQVILPIFIQFN